MPLTPGTRDNPPRIATRVPGRGGRQQRLGGIGTQKLRQLDEGSQRRIRPAAEILQHRRELRQNEQDEEQHDAGGSDEHEGGILHRIDQLAPHLLRSRPLRAEHFQHLVQRAGDLTDADQRGIHRRKQVRVAGDGIGKAFARKQRGAKLADDGTEPSDIGIAREQLERVVEPGAGLQQQRKVARESCNLGGTRPAEQAVST
jgi:hypothetical protein